ncbi:hypothetical protein AB0L75_24225 [Streptomyces sp. NPDC052101]|uniref:hypothetical protein n=1 Tax=Streptomyces sp. NPDC052101 TaxID=3155763 RepID=UPI00343D3CEC
MRIRHALTGLVLGGAIALGGAVVPAQAAELTQSAKVSASDTAAAAPSWHYRATYYNDPTMCENAGKATGLPYKCEFGLPGAVLPIFLYVWY